MMRRALFLILSFMLVATSYSTGQARGADPAVDRIVICAGSQATVVYIDASGQPTDAPHICPECALHTLDVLPVAGFGFGPSPVFVHHAVRQVEQAVHRLVHGRAMARAPPALI